MNASQLAAVDLVVAFLATAAWIGAAVMLGTGRLLLARALCALAVTVSLGRVATTVALAAEGWWFAQEKVTLTLPLLLAGGVTAAVLAGPRVFGGARPAAGRAVAGLLTAGYAAAAGLVFPLLIGYPATWSAALLTVTLVGAATLITWRAAGLAGTGGVARAGTALVALAAVVGAGLAFVPGDTVDSGGVPSRLAASRARPVSALRGPTEPAGGGTVRRYELTARQATVTLASGRTVAAWTYNGQVPGPALTATEGDLIEVTLRNQDIDRGVTLHWHGYDVPNAEDGAPGVTQDAVLPGQEHVYRFLANQVGTYWYHTHQVSDRGVRLGLYGTLVVAPRGAASTGLDLAIPVHTFAGEVAFGTHDRADVRETRPGTSVRLRLINTDSTPRRFTLAGTPYRLVAVDGNDLNRPGELSRTGLRLPAGGRYDLAFTMPDGPVALLAGDDLMTGLRLSPDGSAPAVENTANWPELELTRYGSPASGEFGPDSRFDRHFTMVLDRGVRLSGGPKYAHTINGRAYPATPTQIVRADDLVRVTVVNRGFETHPWHLHGHRVLVLTKDGRAPAGSPLLLDTFDVRPGEVWEVGFRATNPGLWMNHCHNLSHADLGMALHLTYEGVSSSFHDGHS
ncbi:multicopper oxidase family protein [Micromonospora sp. CPCC 206061]|uniref:multicopper oxidase family protein n=1 Tax=Micromonospora sp. CPCC 206061 TaxID=3122410 RepID=UPI002FEF165F